MVFETIKFKQVLLRFSEARKFNLLKYMIYFLGYNFFIFLNLSLKVAPVALHILLLADRGRHTKSKNCTTSQKLELT